MQAETERTSSWSRAGENGMDDGGLEDSRYQSFTYSPKDSTGISSTHVRPGSPTRVTMHRTGSVVIDSGVYSSTRNVNMGAQRTNGGGAPGVGAQSSNPDEELRVIRAAIRRFDDIRTSNGSGVGPSKQPEVSQQMPQQRASPYPSYLPQRSPTRSPAPDNYTRGTEGISGEGLGVGAQQSQKAVLAALKTLHERIRKLEAEKASAIEEGKMLRHQLAQQRAAHEHQQELAAISAQERQTATRLAFERLLADKRADDVKLGKAEEHKAALLREIEDMKARAQQAELARRTAESKAATVHAKLEALQSELASLQSAQQDSQMTLAQRREEQVRSLEALQIKVGQEEAAVAAERSLRQEAEAKLQALQANKHQNDAFVAGILRVNEDLARRVAPAPEHKPRRKKVSSKAARNSLAAKDKQQPNPTTYNFGSHTARRASQTSAANPSRDGRPATATTSGKSGRKVSAKGTSTSTRGPGAGKTALRRRAAKTSSALGVPPPFLPGGGVGAESSFSVPAAVSRAVKDARRNAPTYGISEVRYQAAEVPAQRSRKIQEIDIRPRGRLFPGVCDELERRVQQSNSEVPHMFDEHDCAQQEQSENNHNHQWASRRNNNYDTGERNEHRAEPFERFDRSVLEDDWRGDEPLR